MEIIETKIFTKQVTKYLSDEEYRIFQMEIVRRPDCGPKISGSGGLRKVRWGSKGHGKSGGVRVIYYWFTLDDKLLFLYMYPKNVQDDLTHDQLMVVCKVVEREIWP